MSNQFVNKNHQIFEPVFASTIHKVINNSTGINRDHAATPDVTNAYYIPIQARLKNAQTTLCNNSLQFFE